MNTYAILKSCKWFFVGVLFVLLLGGFLLLFNGKAGSFILLNTYHSPLVDIFFSCYTMVGDGIFALCIVAFYFLYFKKKKQGFALLTAFLVSSLIAQLLKASVNSPRPKLFFQEFQNIQYLHFIDGVTLYNSSSFPSGHTATAFAMATVLAIIIKNKNWQMPLLLAAVLVGYSRIYLAQHFLLDTLVGAAIGAVSGIWAVYITRHIKDFKRIRNKIKNIEPTDTLLVSTSN